MLKAYAEYEVKTSQEFSFPQKNLLLLIAKRFDVISTQKEKRFNFYPENGQEFCPFGSEALRSIHLEDKTANPAKLNQLCTQRNSYPVSRYFSTSFKIIISYFKILCPKLLVGFELWPSLIRFFDANHSATWIILSKMKEF